MTLVWSRSRPHLFSWRWGWSESSELRLEGTALDFLDTRGGSVDLKFFLGRQPSKRARKRDLQWFRQEEARRLLLACRALKLPWFAFLLESFGGGLHAVKQEKVNSRSRCSKTDPSDAWRRTLRSRSAGPAPTVRRNCGAPEAEQDQAGRRRDLG